MRGPAVQPIVIAAGGTGGHLFPAEALAAELLRRGERIALMTDARSAAYDSAAFAAAERFVLSGAGLSGRGLRGAVSGAFRLVAGTAQARRHLAALNPCAVVGFGGYASFPPLAAARLMGRARPAIILHEQNAVLGRANRFMARAADLLALSFEGTTNVPSGATTAVVGNPVRPALAALAGQPYPVPPEGGALRLLVTGGSQGARIFADVVPPAVAALPEAIRARLLVTQQCRAEDLARTETAYREAGVVADLAPFFPDMAGRLGTAHLVVARAGASTVAELECAGRPAVLVPLPSAIDDHQSANARALAAADAAWVYPQPAFTPAALAERLNSLFTVPARLASAAAAAASLARPQAARVLADAVLARARRLPMGAA